MILNCPSIFLQSKLPISRTLCLSSDMKNTDHLRQQLDNLHKEAQSTRDKANSARLRFLRLSEAAEKLRQQASLSVQTGKEKDARELLLQKKKVMQAMEKSKNRIELLDELAAKLTEVISVKETELIGNVASDLEAGRDAAPTPVRFVSPKEEVPKSSTEVNDFDHNEKLGQNEGLEVGVQNLTESHSENELNNSEQSVDGDVWKEVDAVRSLKATSSYEDFLDHIDSQLHKIQVEIVTSLKFPQLILESKENVQNSKLQDAVEILADVLRIRERIGNIRKTEVGIR
ncbi:hypothetical protein ACH5RR_037367 [Cinchona calisaya]|uniref:Uncharacterized protein n=1 Tax=Cinchona calisaya TaxID=153742 RepID=A0ABD2Y5Z0_9GENT